MSGSPPVPLCSTISARTGAAIKVTKIVAATKAANADLNRLELDVFMVFPPLGSPRYQQNRRRIWKLSRPWAGSVSALPGRHNRANRSAIFPPARAVAMPNPMFFCPQQGGKV